MPISPLPFTANDVIAAILAYLALLYLALWRRDHEPGMGWFCLGATSLAVWIMGVGHSAPTVGTTLAPNGLFVPLYLGLGGISTGLIDYMGTPPHWRRRVRVLLLGPLLLSTLPWVWTIASGTPVQRTLPLVLTTLSYTGMGVLSAWAARREPGAGHAYLGLALASAPLLAILTTLWRPTPNALRYWIAGTMLLFCLTLLTISLLRRRHQLEAEVQRRSRAEQQLTLLNNSLEAEVERRTRELREMVQALETFNRSVSHDLRGPLGGIGQLARLADRALKQGDLAGASRLLQPIAAQADTSGRLVAALLTLAHTSDAPLHLQPIELNVMAQEVAVAVTHARSGKSMPEISIAPLPTVQGDPDLCRAVLTNLLSNAVKFSGEREHGRVVVEAETRSGSVTIHVRDNGVGFGPDEASRLFKPFSQLEPKRFDGHGLGLSIVRRAVERHGGTVGAEGQPGLGATFSFTLPHQAAIGR